MTYELRPFDPRHAEQLSIQRKQETERLVFGDWTYKEWDRFGLDRMPSFSGFRDDVLLGCGGIIPQWEGRASAWAILSVFVNRHDMIWIHKTVKHGLDDFQYQQGFRRIEASVDEPFTAAHRWVTMLGFVSEGLMRCYDPMGRDSRLYARIVI